MIDDCCYEKRRQPLARSLQSAIINQQSSIGFLLYGRTAAKLGKHLAHGLGQWTVDRATAGALVASAAETFGDMSNVQFAFAAQAHTVSPIRQFPEERCHLDAADGENVIDQSFTVFFDRVAAFHLLLRNPRVG